MGAWGESAFDELEEVGDGYLDQDLACNALAACEVIARLKGNPGYTNAYTEKIDNWVAGHKIKPSAAILERASLAIDRILGEDSELRDLWEESGNVEKWRKSVEELRGRLRG